MSKPICKIADIIFVRFELVDLAPQREYLEHFGMFLAYATEETIFYRGYRHSTLLLCCDQRKY